MFLYAESVVGKGGLRWRFMLGLKKMHIGTTNKPLRFTISLIGNRLFYLKKKSHEDITLATESEVVRND